jgi:SPP1 family predicted phage head-tail adaptor
MISGLLNRTMNVWRPVETPDGSGGFTTTFEDRGQVRVKVDQATPAERQVAAQFGAELTHNVYAEPDANIRRNDELRGDGQTLEVTGTSSPSTPIYLKASAVQTQSVHEEEESS